MSKLEWSKLLSEVRRKDINKKNGDELSGINAGGTRTEIERDYDRILFSTPVRRLADKTQVFPLDKNDSVRTRLTHSHEVSNLARSLGVALCYETELFKEINNAERNIPSMLAAVGLAHDIGNPPFGHQGELSIGSWFKENDVFNGEDITEQMKLDYIDFEGNAQALRILTKLQILNDKFGLNLTCSSLAALMKYPTSSDKRDKTKKNKAKSKFGYFFSETEVCQEIWEQTGLSTGIRHPLAYIMEASDDIAYAVLDIEDAIKKNLASYRDLISYLLIHANNDVITKEVINKSEKVFEKFKAEPISPSERNDISMQMFRVFAISVLVREVKSCFENNYEKIIDCIFEDDLISSSNAKIFCKHLKSFAFEHAYKHRSVLELELHGHKVIHSIMDMLWKAIVSRGDPLIEEKHKGSPFEKYAYSIISENYKRLFEDKENKLPLPYKRAQLLADMVAGMTDTFAIDFEEKLRSFK
jgi:dGTPase